MQLSNTKINTTLTETNYNTGSRLLWHLAWIWSRHILKGKDKAEVIRKEKNKQDRKEASYKKQKEVIN